MAKLHSKKNAYGEPIDEQVKEDDHGPDALRMLNDKLAACGYSPVDVDNYDRQLRVLAERLFVVREGFPRLTMNSFSPQLPVGIGGILYELSIAACNPWLVATMPGDSGTTFLH